MGKTENIIDVLVAMAFAHAPDDELTTIIEYSKDILDGKTSEYEEAFNTIKNKYAEHIIHVKGGKQ